MKFFLKLIYLLVPPIVFKVFKKKTYQYKLKFNTYKEAKKASGTYFDLNSIKKFFGPEDVQVTGRFNLVALLTLSLNKKNIQILDYGGGANPVYSYIENSTNIKTLTSVIEPKAFNKIMKTKVPNKYKNYIKYYNSIEDLSQKYFDIVCFNSSIQYLEEYKNLIKDLIKYKPKYFLITRTNFHEGKKNYIVLESGIKGSLHPYIIFSFSNLVNFMKEKKYKLIFSNKYNVNRYKHKTIDSNKFFHRDLIFKKI